jgi:hypothetical protein
MPEKREYKDKPQPSSDITDDMKLVLEEFKVVSEEARNIMTRYVQMLALYVAVVGFLAPEMVNKKSIETNLLWLSGISLLNGGAYVAARRFRNMAYHYLDRLDILAKHLKFQKPHPMIWGYKVGVRLFFGVQIIVTAYLGYRILVLLQ